MHLCGGGEAFLSTLALRHNALPKADGQRAVLVLDELADSSAGLVPPSAIDRQTCLQHEGTAKAASEDSPHGRSDRASGSISSRDDLSRRGFPVPYLDGVGVSHRQYHCGLNAVAVISRSIAFHAQTH
jgi:hypothetical protein